MTLKCIAWPSGSEDLHDVTRHWAEIPGGPQVKGTDVKQAAAGQWCPLGLTVLQNTVGQQTGMCACVQEHRCRAKLLGA